MSESFSLPATSAAPRSRSSLHAPATVARLDNGLTLIHQHIATTPVVVVDVWVKAGAIVEPLAWTGMAHFLEHMVFKGTERIPPGWFDHLVEARGGMTNAATSYDYAHYFMVIAAEQVAAVLPHFAELLLAASIPETEFGRERDVVLEEIRQSYDDPDWVGLQALHEMVYPHHAYGRPILGSVESLHGQSPADMRQFHQAHYQPENMTVVVVGGLAAQTTLDLVQAAFQQFPAPPACPAAAPLSPPPPRYGVERQTLTLPRLEQARLLMAWTAPGVQHLADAHGLDLLATLLADGRSSRLVKELREERQWVQDISSSFSLQRESSLFTIAVWLEPERIAAVEALIGDRLMELVDLPIQEAELKRGQRLLCNDYAFSTETSGQLAGLYGYYHTIGHLPGAVQYPQRINSYTTVDLQRLGRTYLRPETYTAVVLQPA